MQVYAISNEDTVHFLIDCPALFIGRNYFNIQNYMLQTSLENTVHWLISIFSD